MGLLRIIVTFINDKWTMNHGILQQFIQPKGDNNCKRIVCGIENIEGICRSYQSELESKIVPI